MTHSRYHGNDHHKTTLGITEIFSFRFLALLDYVSRAHEIEIRMSSVVRRPSVASIISEVTAWIAFKFHLWLPLGYTLGRFFNF